MFNQHLPRVMKSQLSQYCTRCVYYVVITRIISSMVVVKRAYIVDEGSHGFTKVHAKEMCCALSLLKILPVIK